MSYTLGDVSSIAEDQAKSLDVSPSDFTAKKIRAANYGWDQIKLKLRLEDVKWQRIYASFSTVKNQDTYTVTQIGNSFDRSTHVEFVKIQPSGQESFTSVQRGQQESERWIMLKNQKNAVFTEWLHDFSRFLHTLYIAPTPTEALKIEMAFDLDPSLLAAGSADSALFDADEVLMWPHGLLAASYLAMSVNSERANQLAAMALADLDQKILDMNVPSRSDRQPWQMRRYRGKGSGFTYWT